MSLGVVVLGGNRQRGSCPTGVIVLQGSCPRGNCPKGSCPRGSCPRGSCPRTALHWQFIGVHCLYDIRSLGWGYVLNWGGGGPPCRMLI